VDTVERFSILYFAQEGNIHDICPEPISKSVPVPRVLQTETTTPLVGSYVPGSITVFAGSESIQGGSEATMFLGEMSQYIYGKASNQTTFEVSLEVVDKFEDPILEIGGLENSAPLKISLNGHVLFEGTSAFQFDRWTIKEFPLSTEQLQKGTNRLEIVNTGNGPVSASPWFGLAFVRLKRAR
jgi:hypothetical protein